MKTLALTTLLLTAAPIAAQACTGTVLLGNDPGEGEKTISVGRSAVIHDLDHVLRSRKKPLVLACKSKDCYLALSEFDDHSPQKVMDLDGCEIADKGTPEGQWERFEIDHPVAQAAPPGDDDVGPHGGSLALDRKKIVAAGVALAAMANIAAPQIAVDSPTTAHVVGNWTTQSDARDRFIVKKEGACQYTLTHFDKAGSYRIDRIDFSLLSGHRSWNDNHVEFAFKSSEGAYTALHRRVLNYSGLYLYVNRASSIERLVHNVEYMFKNGCDQSIVRDDHIPDDPY